MNRYANHSTLLALLLTLTAPTWAKNVDLSTVPDRATVQLTIYNSEDLTLVRETRKVSFKKGANPLQFSWANTLIDPSSVELKFTTQADKLAVADTVFPHDKPQMLYWNVTSEFDGEATVEITYFTSGISWSADYVCIANRQETTMNIESFVRVHNNSGEEYENAQVRLVVGTINLVEKIAQLARIPMSQVDKLADGEKQEWRMKGARQMLDGADLSISNVMPAGAASPKQVIKEGLSEYFIYTIEGTETIPNGWSKRLRSFEAKASPFKIQYRYRPAEYGDQLVRMYLLTNDEKSKLGTTPLPDGVVRIFRDNGRDGLSFLAAQSVKYIAIGDKIELNLGPDPDVIFELIKLRAFRDNIWVHWNSGRIVQRVDDGTVKIDVDASVAGWDDHAIYTQRIRNYTAKEIEVEIRRPYSGHTIFRSELEPTLYDYRTVQFVTHVKPGKKKDLLFEVVTRQGRNHKQNNVTLEPAEIKP
jgi:hypothetical protein